jgi:alpha-1,3-rhamnosyl/mannosyltransferase
MLSRLGPEDVIIPFTAYHSRADLAAAYRSFGLDHERLASPVRLALPRPVLYDAWHRLSLPRVGRWCPDLASADLVHAPSPAVPPRGRRPLVVTVHDAAFALYPEAYPRRGLRFHQQGVDAAARRADLVITGTQAAADEISAHTRVAAHKLRVVPNGVDHIEADGDEVDRTLAQFGLADAPYVLWVGSLEPRKGVGTLISAFARQSSMTTTDGPSHRLVLVGPTGWLGGGAIDKSEILRLGNRFRSLGHVGESQLRALYAGADLFAFPSWHEGFGLPVLEAMVQGTAVMCSDLPVLREVAGGAAHFVRSGDVEQWTAALEELLGRPALRSALADAGRARAADFSWERTAMATRQVYVEALGG